MEYRYIPKGVCSRMMEISLDDGIIQDVKIYGGCSGNLQAVSALVKGMPAQEAIRRLRGIRCGMKPTSCPDQLAIALEQTIEKNN